MKYFAVGGIWTADHWWWRWQLDHLYHLFRSICSSSPQKVELVWCFVQVVDVRKLDGDDVGCQRFDERTTAIAVDDVCDEKRLLAEEEPVDGEKIFLPLQHFTEESKPYIVYM